MDLYAVLFYLQKAKENQEAKLQKELYTLKLLIMAIHADPEKMMDRISGLEYKAEGGYDEEIGDIEKLKRLGRGQGNGTK